MYTRIAASAVLLLSSNAALAAGPFLDLYYVPSAEIEVTFPGFGSGNDDGDGFGFKGMVPADTIAVTAEYQTVSYDDSGLDNDQLRLGIGLIGPTTSGVFIEYIDSSLDDASADGFGLHGRLAGPMFYGQVGYVALEDDFETISGIEFVIGAAFGGERGGVGGFVDLRKSMLEGEDSDVEYEFTDLRVGIRFRF